MRSQRRHCGFAPSQRTLRSRQRVQAMWRASRAMGSVQCGRSKAQSGKKADKGQMCTSKAAVRAHRQVLHRSLYLAQKRWNEEQQARCDAFPHWITPSMGRLC